MCSRGCRRAESDNVIRYRLSCRLAEAVKAALVAVHFAAASNATEVIVHVRETDANDLDDVLGIHRDAFGQDEEAQLVVELLADPTAQPLLSLLANEDDEPVGHVLFGAVRGIVLPQVLRSALLAPLAVLPGRQRAGIGRALIEHGCRLLAERGVGLVFVLGDPPYYGRSGFVPATAYGLQAPYPIQPEAAWQVRELTPGLLGAGRGTVQPADVITAEHFWRE